MTKLTMAEVNKTPSLYGEAIAGLVEGALAADESAIALRSSRECPVCGVAAMVQFGVLATGKPLSLYTPAKGEVLKNRYMECVACGFEQAS